MNARNPPMGRHRIPIKKEYNPMEGIRFLIISFIFFFIGLSSVIYIINHMKNPLKEQVQTQPVYTTPAIEN